MFAAVTLAGALAGSPAEAQQFTTSLVDVRQGSELSDKVMALGEGGYELAYGDWVSLSQWYHTDWPDLHIDFLTQYAEDSGILWGISTGERGIKYRIDPSLTLGLITQTHPSTASTLSLSVTGTLWGNLTEFPCEADYGELGTYTVNCRLAATELAPEYTLKYLLNDAPSRLHISLSFRANF